MIRTVKELRDLLEGFEDNQPVIVQKGTTAQMEPHDIEGVFVGAYDECVIQLED